MMNMYFLGCLVVLMGGCLLVFAFNQYKRQEDLGEWVINAAEEGNVDAMVSLGSVYEVYGDDDQSEGSEHYNRAIKWYKKAAQGQQGMYQGHVIAMYHLGEMYQKGKGQPQGKPNDKEAIKWLKKAAAGGEAKAMYNLGVIYFDRYDETGSQSSYRESMKWYKRAVTESSEEEMHEIIKLSQTDKYRLSVETQEM